MKIIYYGSIMLCVMTLSVQPIFGVFERGGSHTLTDRESTIWTGRDRDGKVISKADINRVIQLHKRWLETNGEDGKKADLKRADLRGINFWKVNLEKASLEYVNFKDANLMWANFKGADLSEANIQKGNLWEANLEDSNLMGTDLTGADLSGANLQKPVFELESKKVPNIQLLAMAEHLLFQPFIRISYWLERF